MARIRSASPSRGDVTASTPAVETSSARRVLAARNAVALSFFLNGFLFSSWVSRIPEVRSDLSLSNGRLGLLLLCIAAGSLLAMPLSGSAIQRWGTVVVVRTAGAIASCGMIVAVFGVTSFVSYAVTGLGLFAAGLGIGVWDVAMNVEGADVERRLARTIMPRFHAGFSFGTVAGAGLGALVIWAGVPMVAHLCGVALGGLALMLWSARLFMPIPPPAEEEVRRSVWVAWVEPRTIMIGLMVLALAVTEGTANDWLAVALVDGYGAAHWVGVAGFALFVSAMTAGRLFGPVFLDRFGQSSVLWATMMLAIVGVLAIVYGGHVVIVSLGIVMWGIGASLGFPVGMSAAAADPVHAAARVSVVSTIGYAAFLAGPPLLGFVGDQVGTLNALLVVAALLVPAMLLVPFAAIPVPRTST
jgi:MFS family permease